MKMGLSLCRICKKSTLTVVVTFVPGPGNRSFEIGASRNSAGKSVVSISTISVLYGVTLRVFELVFE